MVTPSPAGDLTLGHVLAAAGVDLDDVVVIRHTVWGDALGPDVRVIAGSSDGRWQG